MIKNRF